MSFRRRRRHRVALTRLDDAVSRAEAMMREPPAEGEVKHVLPLPAYLDGEGNSAKWDVVSALKERDRPLYNRFGNENFLAETIIELIHERGGRIGSWGHLVAGLERFVDESSEWLVSVPLSNATLAGYTEIGERIGLAEVLQDENWDRQAESPVDAMTIARHLGDRIGLSARWHRADSYTGPLDGRRTAALLIVEQGAEPVAVSVARTRARYALALWCLLVPPDRDQLWPSLGDWEPRPYIERGTTRKLFEPGTWAGVRSPERGKGIYHYSEYELPRKPEIVRAPFEAMERAAENRLSARAALSAAWSLFLAERKPYELERTDRIVLVSAAIEALCDLGQGPTDGGKGRWAALSDRFGVWDEIRDSYSGKEIEEAKSLARDLRNLTMHGSDDTLVNLGYPPELIRKLSRPRKGDDEGRSRSGEELSLAQTAAIYPVIATAVRLAASRVVQQGIDSGWNDAVFRSNFEA